jgi:hypothetical protein
VLLAVVIPGGTAAHVCLPFVRPPTGEAYQQSCRGPSAPLGVASQNMPYPAGT